MGITAELIGILLLVLLNGVLAMTETALVSSRKARLKQRADRGDQGARAALDLAESPGRFLSTVQIGITLVGILAGAFGGATLAEELAVPLSEIPWLARYAEGVSFALVVTGVTYLSLVLGELVPKQIALSAPEGIASRMARPLAGLQRLATPMVYVLDLSTRVVLRLLGRKPPEEPPVTEEEVRILLKQGTRAGVFETGEEPIASRVLRLGERRVGEMITPRLQMTALNVLDPPEEVWHRIAEGGHSYYPVFEGVPDRVLGVVSFHDLWLAARDGRPLDLRAALRKPVFLPESLPALAALERFRSTGADMALVLDEYGGLEGILTPADLFEAMVGDLPTAGEPEAMVVRRDDGSWLLDGMLPVVELEDLLDLRGGAEELDEYQSLGGFVMGRLGRVPGEGDGFEWRGHRFEVVDMDGRRVDKVLLVPPAGAPGEGAEGPAPG